MATQTERVTLEISRTEVLTALRAAGYIIPDAGDPGIQSINAEVNGPELVISWTKESDNP